MTSGTLGESYGTHIGQIALHEAPQGLRSVILDSVVPVVIPTLPEGRSSFENSLLRLFQRCQEDPACNAAYPNLSDTLQRAIQHLQQNPVLLQTNCYGEDKSAELTEERFVTMLFSALYETDSIPALPYAITAAADGSDYSFWNNVVCMEYVIDNIVSYGAHWATQCSDGRSGYECDNWPVAIEQTLVQSELPVLILSGEFDPVTPPEYGHSAAEGLPNSFSFDFPGIGHWVNGTGHPCQAEIIQSFLDDPHREPDGSCIAEMQHRFYFEW